MARKIARIETFVVPPRWLFVRVESEDGAVGWGEASLEGWAEAVDGVFEAYRDRFIGADPFAHLAAKHLPGGEPKHPALQVP
jgi:galactonate dehydratase